ncbi:MAG: hypothetical protein H0V09_00980 [Gemmatimonadetes bacterium]|nr:hypothetical protein [Gemmatimonadota bacterium]
MTVVCRNCGAIVPSTVRSCAQCGYQLALGADPITGRGGSTVAIGRLLGAFWLLACAVGGAFVGFGIVDGTVEYLPPGSSRQPPIILLAISAAAAGVLGTRLLLWPSPSLFDVSLVAGLIVATAGAGLLMTTDAGVLGRAILVTGGVAAVFAYIARGRRRPLDG